MKNHTISKIRDAMDEILSLSFFRSNDSFGMLRLSTIILFGIFEEQRIQSEVSLKAFEEQEKQNEFSRKILEEQVRQTELLQQISNNQNG